MFYRKVKHNVGVDVIIVSLSSKEEFNAKLIQESVESALIKVLNTGLLGPFHLVYAGSKDLHVEQAFLGKYL